MFPHLVPGDLLGEANSALQMASQGLRVITSLMGAGLLAWVEGHARNLTQNVRNLTS